MGIVIFEEDPLIFGIKRFGKRKRVFNYELESPAANVKKLWTKTIENLLWRQLEQHKGKSLKIYYTIRVKTERTNSDYVAYIFNNFKITLFIEFIIVQFWRR